MADIGLPTDSPPVPRLPWEFMVSQVVLLVGIALIPAHDYRHLTCQLMFGLVLSQGVLAGAWLAGGPGSRIMRIIGAPLWLLLAAGVGGFVNRPDGSSGFELFLGIFAGTTFVISLLLLGRQWMFGCRLAQPDDNSRSRWQYGLKHLLLLTAAASVLAAGARFVGVQSVQFFFVVLYYLAPAGGVFAIGMIPTVLVPLAVNDRGWLILGFVVAAGSSLISAFVAGWVLETFVYPDEAFPTVAMMTGMTAYFAVALSMLLLRAAGYRLQNKRSIKFSSGE